MWLAIHDFVVDFIAALVVLTVLVCLAGLLGVPVDKVGDFLAVCMIWMFVRYRNQRSRDEEHKEQ